ncbi:MAG: flagellar protein FlgN [Ancrocorticia sp.]|nr:flagellar protein FlgN [Ancrocorticia sp.]MCI2178359.1 flagellar protein FlgN [Ancrocorticia sp.]MCI2193165.1 flagellar protein FlgN [Ancrocorticia sp.]MCI2198835.1 flagellar protein FlgN [Ancrocorticia sp.]
MTQKTLSDVLWHERDVLEELLYRLDVQCLLLAAGRSDYVARAAREAEDAARSVQTVELARATESDSVATSLGLNPQAPLRVIAAASPAPWNSIFDEHRTALIDLTTRIKKANDQARSELASSSRALQELVATLTDAAPTYDRDGKVRFDTPPSTGIINTSL